MFQLYPEQRFDDLAVQAWTPSGNGPHQFSRLKCFVNDPEGPFISDQEAEEIIESRLDRPCLVWRAGCCTMGEGCLSNITYLVHTFPLVS
jgi:hypothetical protein